MSDTEIVIDSLEPDRLPDEPEPEKPDPAESAEAAAEEGDDTEESATSEEDGDDAAADDQEGDPKPKKAKGVQKRISELTANWRNAERQAEHWREMAMRGGQPPQQPQSRQPAAPTAPKQEDFQNYDDFLVARAKHETRMEIMSEVRAHREQQEVAERTARVQQTTTAFRERVEAAKARYDDFEGVAFSEEVAITETMAQAIVESEAGPDVSYYLGSHPDEARRIASLSPLAQAREIGKIELKIAEPPKKTTTAPPPAKTIKGAGSPERDPSKMSNAEYAAWRTGKK